MRLIIGISGASGVIMGLHLMRALKEHSCETHLIITKAAMNTWEAETDLPLSELTSLADALYAEDDLSAVISSGSFITDGMIVMPCSMKTLAGITVGFADNLLLRAADVCLKENRRVVLVPREMPLGRVHIRNLMGASELGCVIVPPVLTFYNKAQTIEDQIQHVIGKVLLQFGLEHRNFKPWKGR